MGNFIFAPAFIEGYRFMKGDKNMIAPLRLTLQQPAMLKFRGGEEVSKASSQNNTSETNPTNQSSTTETKPKTGRVSISPEEKAQQDAYWGGWNPLNI